MTNRPILIYFIFSMILGTCMPVFGQNITTPDINPLEQGITKFLDNNLEEMDWQANQAYRQKDYSTAAKWYLALLQHRTNAESAIYNLACCYGQLKKPELAARTLWQAIQAGFDNLDWVLTDPDFDKVRKHSDFQLVLKRIELLKSHTGEQIFLESRNVVPCRIHLPENYDPNQTYPLVIGLHGSGSHPDNFASIWSFMKAPQFILAVPQGPYLRETHYLTKTEQWNWALPTRDSTLWAQIDDITVESIYNMIQSLKKRYSVDHVFIMGFSQGASYAYAVGMQHHQEIDGILSLSGYLPETGHSYSLLSDSLLSQAVSLPIFIAHGSRDAAINISQSERAKNSLQKLGFDVTFIPFDGGHHVSPQVLEEAQSWIHRLTIIEK